MRVEKCKIFPAILKLQQKVKKLENLDDFILARSGRLYGGTIIQR
jgi:hypothetical protein